jgi:hypothetical protein
MIVYMSCLQKYSVCRQTFLVLGELHQGETAETISIYKVSVKKNLKFKIR